MKGYKSFEKGLVCRGKQYAENTVFEEERAEICESGIVALAGKQDGKRTFLNEKRVITAEAIRIITKRIK